MHMYTVLFSEELKLCTCCGCCVALPCCLFDLAYYFSRIRIVPVVTLRLSSPMYRGE